MDLDGPMQPKPPAGVTLGESLAVLSTDDLTARLEMLDTEKRRIEAEIAHRRISRDAAEAFFKR